MGFARRFTGVHAFELVGGADAAVAGADGEAGRTANRCSAVTATTAAPEQSKHKNYRND